MESHRFDRVEVSCLAGEKAVEEKLGYVYRRAAELEEGPDARRVFERLRAASRESRLPAFRRCLARVADSGNPREKLVAMKPSSCLGTTPYLGPEDYDRWRASELGALTEVLEDRLLLKLVGDPSGRRALDVGCGDGAFTLALTERGAYAVGIDASEAMISAAARRLTLSKKEAHLCVGMTEQLPFAPETFDLVLAKTVLCFVEDASGVFAEIARVLRPGGRLVIGELGRYSPWAFRRLIRGRLGSPLWRHGHFRTARELRRSAEGAGLTVECIRGAVYYPRSRILARLMHRWDDVFAHISTIGAAFLALSASKPD